jgi:hypothetical protein
LIGTGSRAIVQHRASKLLHQTILRALRQILKISIDFIHLSQPDDSSASPTQPRA